MVVFKTVFFAWTYSLVFMKLRIIVYSEICTHNVYITSFFSALPLFLAVTMKTVSEKLSLLRPATFLYN